MNSLRTSGDIWAAQRDRRVSRIPATAKEARRRPTGVMPDRLSAGNPEGDSNMAAVGSGGKFVLPIASLDIPEEGAR